MSFNQPHYITEAVTHKTLPNRVSAHAVVEMSVGLVQKRRIGWEQLSVSGVQCNVNRHMLIFT